MADRPDDVKPYASTDAGKAAAAEKKKTKKTWDEAVSEVGSLIAAESKGSKSADDPLVYLGNIGDIYGKKATGPLLAGQQAPVFKTLTEVGQQYHNFDSKTKNKFLSQLGLAGYDVDGMKDGQLVALWQSYAQQAAAYLAAGQQLTPWDILAKDMAQREAAMSAPRTVTQKSTSYNMSTREDAHAIFMQAAQTLLGRDPTKAEITSFQKSLNAYEKANPSVTTATQRFVGGELQSQESTTTGGVSQGAREIMAIEEAKKDPEYGAYQAATNGMNWLMEMIGG